MPIPGSVLQGHVTRHCNLSCAHCYSSSGPHLKGGLPLEVLAGLFGEAVDEGYEILSLSGGEPLMDPNLFAEIDAARRAGLRVNVVSRQGRSFFASRVAEFQVADPDAIVGQLASRHVAFHASAEAEQMRAWAREIVLLKAAFAEVGDVAAEWWILLEAPLLRSPPVRAAYRRRVRVAMLCS